MKILNVVGARPQFIKAAVISRVVRRIPEIEEVVVHTGQHYDINMSKIFFSELGIPEPHINLEVGSASHAMQTAMIMERIEKVLEQENPDWVIVYGDTNSTLAGALAATKMNLKVCHVEAGLRSFNRQMPEETNRIVTDHVSDYLFAPTMHALELLNNEGLGNKSIFVGDVMYDSLLHYKDMVDLKFRLSDFMPYNDYYLATVHRQENTDDMIKLKNLFSALGKLDYPILLPLHPRTRKLIGSDKVYSNVMIIEPVGYLEMIFLMKNARKILTDSGGIQKEAYLLQKPCITLREETEWVETLTGNWNFLVGMNENLLKDKIKVNNYGPQNNYFGEGNAAEKIIKKLMEA